MHAASASPPSRTSSPRWRRVERVVGTPPAQVLAKVIDHLDDLCRDFIVWSPFCVVATANPAGHIDLSPKGDPAGFVRVLDEHRRAIPDRPGNRRTDTFHNLLVDPRIAIILLIPGKAKTLRVSGEAPVVRDLALRETMAVKHRVPELATVVYVEHVFMHCPKCMVRSGSWLPDRWPDSRDLDDIGRAMIRHGKLETTPEELEAFAQREGFLELY